MRRIADGVRVARVRGQSRCIFPRVMARAGFVPHRVTRTIMRTKRLCLHRATHGPRLPRISGAHPRALIGHPPLVLTGGGNACSTHARSPHSRISANRVPTALMRSDGAIIVEVWGCGISFLWALGIQLVSGKIRRISYSPPMNAAAHPASPRRPSRRLHANIRLQNTGLVRTAFVHARSHQARKTN